MTGSLGHVSPEKSGGGGRGAGSGPGGGRGGFTITGPGGRAAAGIRTSGMRPAAAAAAWTRVLLGSGGLFANNGIITCRCLLIVKPCPKKIKKEGHGVVHHVQ